MTISHPLTFTLNLSSTLTFSSQFRIILNLKSNFRNLVKKMYFCAELKFFNKWIYQ